MSSLWNEFRFSSRSVALPIAVIVIGALAVGTAFFAVGHQYDVQPDAGIAYYYSGDAFHFLVYVYNSAGDPLPDARVDAQLSIGGPNGTPITGNASGSTGTDGLGSLVVAAPNEPASALVSYSIPGSTESYSLQIGPLAPGSIGDDEGLGIVNLGTVATIPGVLGFVVGSNGSPPVGYTVDFDYYCPYAGLPCSDSANVTGTLGTLTSYVGVYRFVKPLDVPVADWLNLSIRAPSGSVVYSLVSVGNGVPTPLVTPPAPAEALLAVGTSPQFLLWPVIGVLAGVFTHGRSRTSGYFESTLARPTNRPELIFAHFSAGALWAGVPVVVAMAAVQATVLAEFRLVFPFLPLALVGLAIWATVLAWLGATMLISQLSRAILVTTLLPLILVLLSTVGWQYIESALGVNLSTPGVFAYSILNPCLLPTLMPYAAAPEVSRDMLHALPFGPSGALITGLACLAWALGPVVGAALLWLRRD